MARGRNRSGSHRAALTDAEVDRIAARLRGDVSKLAGPTAERAAGRTYTTDQVLAALAAATGGGGAFLPMARDPRDDVPFGPLRPLAPVPFDPARPDTGRPGPRISEYPPAWNVPGAGDRLIPWRVLRAAVASGGVDIMRTCIEVRKKRVCGLPWTWKVRPETVEAEFRRDNSRGHDDIAAELRDRWAADIARLTTFWQHPWKSQGLDFKGWVRGMMEERLVLDALVLYPQTSYGGDLLALEIIAGDTVKPLIDYRGARPVPPFPAYQQILYGFPRGEFAATTVTDADGNTVMESAFLADQMIYIRENYRAFTPYGFSPVEQALTSARLYLKRQGWMFAEYDEGVLGEAYATLPEASPLTPTERKAWEQSLNDELAGQTAARHRLKALFPGMGLVFPPDNAERYKPEYDLFLIKLVCSHFGVPVSELGFTETRGLGGAGMHESMKEAQNDSATQPDIDFIEALVNVTSADLLRAPAELYFGFDDPDGEDEKDADAMADSRVKRGSATINDDRTRLGMPRYNFPEADMPFIMGAGGPVFLEGSSQAQQQQAIEGNFDPRAARSPDKPSDPQPVDESVDNPSDGPDAKPTATKAADPGAKLAELAAYRRFARRDRPRPFEWVHHTADEVAEILKAAPDPKAPPAPGEVPPAPDTRWPGWLVDVALAAFVAGRLRAALAPWRGLAARVKAWAVGGAPVSTPGVRSWLTSENALAEVEGPLLFAVRDALTEGYVAGARSAQHVLAVGLTGTVDWGGWKPGDVAAARRVLSADGMTVGLEQLLDDAGARVSKIAAGRLDEVAAVLADGLERGEGVDAIATALRGILDDPVWAEMTAWTETNRAMSAAAVDSYELAGVDGKAWFTANDQRVCPLCAANEGQGPIRLYSAFISGDQHPPGHPRCRCAVVPEDLDDTAVKGAGADLVKVGPKGYIHGWIFVGAPGVGDLVHHPQHGAGHVTHAEGGRVHVSFVGGSHSFEQVKGNGPGGLRQRHVRVTMHVSQIDFGDEVKHEGRWREVAGWRGYRHNRDELSLRKPEGGWDHIAVKPDQRIEVRTKRAEFMPVVGFRNERMAQWRSEAARPGREAVLGESKREEMIAANIERLKEAERVLAAKRAEVAAEMKRQRMPMHKRDAFMADRTRSEAHDVTLAEYGVQFVRTMPSTGRDEKIDEPRVIGHVPAQKIDVHRPLAVYGDMLHIQSGDSMAHAHLTHLETVDPYTHALIAEHLAGGNHAHVGIYVGSESVPDLDDLKYLRDVARTPGERDSRMSYNEVGGAYVHSGGHSHVVAIGYAGDWGMDTMNSHSTATHEIGHALSDALSVSGTRASGTPEWTKLHALAVAEGDKNGMSPYFRDAEEMWAEGFSQWVAGRGGLGADSPESRLRRTFGIGPGNAFDMANYFAALERRIRTEMKT
jgi:SPP1 gp7 family putative phage head morphogenesis protein